MTRAVPGNPSGNDLPSVGNEIPQPLRVLKIDDLDLINTPLAHLLPSKAPSLFQHSSSPPQRDCVQNGTSSSPRGGSSSESAASFFPPINCTRSATTSYLLRFCPSGVSHDRCWSRPSTSA